MIKVLVLDVDGVVTDGHEIVVAGDDAPAKRIAYIDLDAVHAARREGLEIALLTAEDDAMVRRIAERLGVAAVHAGHKDKVAGIAEVARAHGCSPAEIAFIGDADRDAAAFERCGVSFAPANATVRARADATFALHRRGGDGAIAEAVDIVRKLGRLGR